MDEYLVIYDNRVNLSLEGLSSKNRDLFMSIAYKLKDQDDNVIEVSYRELMTLAKFKHMAIDEFHEYLKNNKLDFINISIWDTRNEEESIDGIPLFSRFTANKQKRRVSFKLNEETAHIFSHLSKNFTKLDLLIFTSLRNKYSKILYQNLCQYKKTGYWSIPIEDGFSDKQPRGFRTIFDVPDAYPNNRIKDKIINIAIEELKPYLNITLETIRQGRKAVGYKFKFTEVTNIITENSVSNDNTILKTQIKSITNLDDLSVTTITNLAESLDKKREEVLEICTYSVEQKDVVNLTKYIINLLVTGFTKPVKKEKKTNKFNNFSQRKYDYAALEQQLVNK